MIAQITQAYGKNTDTNDNSNEEYADRALLVTGSNDEIHSLINQRLFNSFIDNRSDLNASIQPFLLIKNASSTDPVNDFTLKWKNPSGEYPALPITSILSQAKYHNTSIGLNLTITKKLLDIFGGTSAL